MNKVQHCKIYKIEEEKKSEIEELLVREYPLSIFLNKKKLATLLCSPENLKALAIGFLRTEGLIKSIDDIKIINLNEEKSVVSIFTANTDNEQRFFSKKIDLDSISASDETGVQNFLKSLNCKPIESDIKISVTKIFEFMKKDLDYSEVFKKTGGVHCVALCSNKDMLIIYEDVARHNALDKVIGEAITKKMYLKDKIVILSGRVSLEMILKAAKLEIPIIISKSAPTSLSVALAKALNITLVGFVRGNKMNLYANDFRIQND